MNIEYEEESGECDVPYFGGCSSVSAIASEDKHLIVIRVSFVIVNHGCHSELVIM